MAEQSVTRKPYPTDLSDAEWQEIEPLIPKSKTNRGRKRKHPLREILDAIFYLLRAGCAWRMLPHDFPPWKTVYHYFRLWRKEGTWEHINAALRTGLREADGREPEPSAAILDSQSVKTTDVKGVRGYDAGKKVKGRKRHILVDTLGLLLVVVVHAANIQDRDGAKCVLEKARQLFSRLQLIWARAPNVKGFQVLPRRWVVERTFGWLGQYRRLSKDYEVLTETSEAMIYAAMSHLMVRRLARQVQASGP